VQWSAVLIPWFSRAALLWSLPAKQRRSLGARVCACNSARASSGDCLTDSFRVQGLHRSAIAARFLHNLPNAGQAAPQNGGSVQHCCHREGIKAVCSRGSVQTPPFQKAAYPALVKSCMWLNTSTTHGSCELGSCIHHWLVW
jgi:hypothetical protein